MPPYNSTAIAALRKLIRSKQGMTKDQFDAYCDWLYNNYFFGENRNHIKKAYEQAALHAIPGNPQSVSRMPDGSMYLFLDIFMRNTLNEHVRLERGLKVYHVLTAITIPPSYVERIIQAYYPVNMLEIVRDGQHKLVQENGTYVLHV